MLDLLKSPHARSARGGRRRCLQLNREFRLDLLWWQPFAERWNGTSIAAPSPGGTPLQLTSDASSSWGCSAWSEKAWFQWRWDDHSQHLTIEVKELIPIVIAMVVWDESWRGKPVHCQCDNQVIVAALTTRLSWKTHIMHLLRCLFFVEAHYQCQLHTSYISTRDNDIADHLSRNNMTAFRSKLPQADHSPTPIPPACPPPGTPPPENRLAITRLDETVQEYFQRGLAQSTHRTYNTALKQFFVLCNTYEITDPFKVSEHTRATSRFF